MKPLRIACDNPLAVPPRAAPRVANGLRARPARSPEVTRLLMPGSILTTPTGRAVLVLRIVADEVQMRYLDSPEVQLLTMTRRAVSRLMGAV